MSREPWNTGTGGGAVCEDMPRKSLDIRSADHPPAWERGSCAFPCFRRGRVRAEPGRRVKGRVPCGFSGQRPEPSESLPVSISTDFQGSIEPVFLTPLFHSLFDTTRLISFGFRLPETVNILVFMIPYLPAIVLFAVSIITLQKEESFCFLMSLSITIIRL